MTKNETSPPQSGALKGGGELDEGGAGREAANVMLKGGYRWPGDV